MACSDRRPNRQSMSEQSGINAGIKNIHGSKNKLPWMFVILYVLLVRVCADYLAEVPHKRGFACGLLALLRGLVAEGRGLGAAVDAHGVPAPALLLFEQPRAAAVRAVPVIVEV